jgi:hypothetical protein
LTADIDYLPVWKAGATAEERLLELAAIARKHPERFSVFAITYVEKKPNGGIKVRSWEHECSVIESFGIYELAKLWQFENSKFK